MKLTVNGKPYEVKHGSSVSALLKDLGFNGRMVVVVLNDEMVPAGSMKARELRDGDRVDLYRLVGGG